MNIFCEVDNKSSNLLSKVNSNELIKDDSCEKINSSRNSNNKKRK